METVSDPYAILGVPPDATEEQIEEAYRYRLRLHHPDLYPDDDRVRRWAEQLAAARDILLDPQRRAVVDSQQVPARPAPEPTAVEAAPPQPTRSGKVVLTEEQARDGCAVAWVQDAASDASVRTLQIPAGTADGDVLELPADEVDGVSFPPLLLQVIVEAPILAPPPEVVGDREQPRKPRQPHRYKIAAATFAAMAVTLAAAFALGIRESDPLADGVPAVGAGGPTAEDALIAEVAASKAAIRGMAPGSWVPQVSALCAGLTQADLSGEGQALGFPDGRAEAYSALTTADILAFHRALGTRFAAALSEGGPTPECPSETTWVSLVDVAQPSADGVRTWCAEQELPQSSCTPREITAELVASAQYVRQAAHGVSFEVPWAMTATTEGNRTTLTDPGTGATLTIAATPAGEEPTTRAAAEGQLGGPASAPTVSRDETDGFTVSGFTGAGDIYYWRQYRLEQGTVDVVWTYPADARGTFDPAISRAAETFRTVS
jgi:hypothetical protein